MGKKNHKKDYSDLCEKIFLGISWACILVGVVLIFLLYSFTLLVYPLLFVFAPLAAVTAVYSIVLIIMSVSRNSGSIWLPGTSLAAVAAMSIFIAYKVFFASNLPMYVVSAKPLG